MKKLIGIISLSFLILLSGFGSGIYTIVYELAQASLTEQYCVNKANDCCRAKCHVAKVVKEDGEKSKTGKRVSFRQAEFLPQTLLRVHSPQPLFNKKSLAFYRFDHELLLSQNIWHPPMIIA